jgi:hypothetical protein
LIRVCSSRLDWGEVADCNPEAAGLGDAPGPRTSRPLQETPDPDDDPTREWREKWARKQT